MTADVRLVASAALATTTPSLAVSANAGEIIIAHIMFSGSSTQMTTHPAGYTLLDTIVNSSNDSGFIYSRVATGTSADNISCTKATSGASQIVALTCSGVDLVQDHAAGVAAAGVATMDAPSVTAVRSNDLLLCFYSENGASDGVPSGTPPGMTLAASLTPGGVPRQYVYKQNVAAGATGTRTLTTTGTTVAGRDHVASVVLRRSNSAAGTPTALSPADGAVLAGTSVTLQATSTDPDGDNVTYSFQLSTSAGFGSGTVYTVGPVASGVAGSTVVSGLANATTYYWRVLATDALGAASAYAATRSFTTPSALAHVNVQTGGGWAAKPLSRWDGSGWVAVLAAKLKRWSGSAWM